MEFIKIVCADGTVIYVDASISYEEYKETIFVDAK